MKFWKEHATLRVTLIALFFLGGMGLVIYGWTLSGKLAGLGIMLVGLVLLLAALFIYNKPFQDPH